MKHYTKVELDMYRHGDMSVLGRINCGTHLQSCEKCAKLMLELQEDDHLLEELRESLEAFRQFQDEPKKQTTSRP